MLMKSLLPIGALLCLGPTAVGGQPVKQIDFARDVRPILADKCFACHGPDAAQRKGKLRLDTQAGAFRDPHPVIVPGQPEASQIIARVSANNSDERMPPAESGKTLSGEEVATLRAWIEQGATWREHWSFSAPVKSAPPAVTRTDWARNDLDLFILARLEAQELEPQLEADRYTLARRLSLDLTGLPPTIEDVDAFVSDATPLAYDRLVDQLLASPHFGEHLSRYWLDAARYGDTHGMHLDNYRSIWPYRSWVIEAFNDNLPHDRFILEQLAGDLIPDASLEQKVATGFLRCHVTTGEGGSIDEEVHVRNVVDCVNTTASVFLGLTAGCSVCHDHKFDPLTQRDYFQLFAYFNSIDGGPLDGNVADYPPNTKVPTRQQASRLASLRREVEEVEATIRGEIAAYRHQEPHDVKPFSPPPAMDLVWIDDELPAGAVQAGGEWTFHAEPAHSGSRSWGRAAKGINQHVFENAREPLQPAPGDVFFAHCYLDPQNPPREIMLQWNDGSWEHRAYWGDNAIDWGAEGSASRKPMGPLPRLGEWVRLEVAVADVGLAKDARVHGMAFTQFGGKVTWDRSGMVSSQGLPPTFASMAEWIQALQAVASARAPEPVLKAARAGAEKRTTQETKLLRDYFIEHVCTTSRHIFDPLHARQGKLRQELEAVEKQVPSTLVFKERAEPRQAYLLKRGEYDQRGEAVTRGTPAFLPRLVDHAARDRLGLGRWLIHPSHPLTARVAVNRIWQQLFGTGLVKTAEDFGSQGEPPSHPELLDWLAVDFIESGWDTKRLVRRMVTSATYRQLATLTPASLARDPENRLLSRSPRHRLDAETLRDQALAASGLLVWRLGGPSVKPPQPAGLWEAVGFRGSDTANFAADSGDKVYRRSVYTFWKRTSPPPQMSTLDAPSREACTVRRERTNTPLQALLLLNEQQAIETARFLATRVLTETSGSPEDRARFLFRTLAARPPTAEEQAEIAALYRAQHADFIADLEAARALIAVGESRPDPGLDAVELAAWTIAASTILNLDEIVSRN